MTQTQDTPDAPAKVPAQAPAPAQQGQEAQQAQPTAKQTLEVVQPVEVAQPTEAAPQPVFTADTYQAAAQAFSASRQKIRDAKAAHLVDKADVPVKAAAVRTAEADLTVAGSKAMLSGEAVEAAEGEGQEAATSLRAVLDAYIV